MARVLVMTDTHCPFMHTDAVDFLVGVRREYKTTQVIHGGDVADLHFASRFNKHSSNSGDGELDAVAKQVKELTKSFPKAKVCRGNHDERIMDRAEESGIPRRAIRSMNQILGLPIGWQWRDEWTIDGIVYEHGHQYGGKFAHLKAASDNMQSTVIGHVHSHAGVQYIANRRRVVWGMNAGCLLDKNAYAFLYAKKQNKPVVGCGVVIDSVPFFVPMRMDGRGRWTGKV